MGCIYHHCSLLLPPSLESGTNKNSTRSRETGVLWLKCKPNNQLRGIGGGKGLLLQHFPTRQPHPPNSSSLFLSLTSPASSGDYSILLPASAALFFVYWITNFVVPDIISKDFQSDSKGQTPEEVNPMESESPRIPNQVNSSKHTKHKVTRKRSKSS
ncbi:hypothetical protein AAC387_Pa02g1588 [Persea americana]